MQFKLERRGIVIIPDNDLDAAYIEDTLGLRREGDAIAFVRENVYSTNALAKLTSHPFPERPIHIRVPRGSNVEEL